MFRKERGHPEILRNHRSREFDFDAGDTATGALKNSVDLGALLVPEWWNWIRSSHQPA